MNSNRDNNKVQETLNELKSAATEDKNIVPYILSAVKTYATLQEICDTLRDVYGEYQSSTIL